MNHLFRVGPAGLLTVAIVAIVIGSGSMTSVATAREPDRIVDIWPEMAPGEDTASTGEALPRRANEDPPATRIKGITRPQLHIFEATSAGTANGTAVLIFPGGGYNYVVADKEGSETAEWLNTLGITGIVVHYRTKPSSPNGEPLWQRPLQDGQRAIRLVRANADGVNLDVDRIGVMGFSAGGQAAAYVATRYNDSAYRPVDDVDDGSCRPDFAALIYPWNLVNESQSGLRDGLTVPEDAPPTFLLHTHDDHSTSLGSLFFYAELKRRKIPAELHIYESGGHGYGMRPVPGSDVDTWPQRAAVWLSTLDR